MIPLYAPAFMEGQPVPGHTPHPASSKVLQCPLNAPLNDASRLGAYVCHAGVCITYQNYEVGASFSISQRHRKCKELAPKTIQLVSNKAKK